MCDAASREMERVNLEATFAVNLSLTSCFARRFFIVLHTHMYSNIAATVAAAVAVAGKAFFSMSGGEVPSSVRLRSKRCHYDAAAALCLRSPD